MTTKEKTKKQQAPKAKKDMPKLPKIKSANPLKAGTPKEPRFQAVHSIKVKIISIVFCSILATVIITSNVIINYSKTLVVDSAYGKMLNIVSSYGTLLDKSEDGKALTQEEYTALLKDVTLEGMQTANCFLVNKSGIMAYSADESKIGKPNRNSVITKVIAEIAKGRIPENLCTEYEDEDGISRYASFYITTARSVLVMDVTADELMKPIWGLYLRTVIIATVMILLAMAATLLIVNNITRPLEQVTKIIRNTANLKLTSSSHLDRLCLRRDETGEIGRAVKVMTENLKDVVSKIDTANHNIELNMQKLENSSSQVNELCTDNSATTQALAASTEEMANKLTHIGNHMSNMKQQSLNIQEVTENSNRVSAEIAKSAQNMRATTSQAIERTRIMYRQLKEKSDAAIAGLKSVTKINELTEAISDISDQTSLLSLNASIEAARAGDAGRGFAVVATEISNLAKKSMENVNDIDLIIAEINTVVDNISSAMEETIQFLEKNVLADYDGFNNIGKQYLSDADTFQSTMSEISGQVEALNDAIAQIVNNLNDIQNTMSETSLGVTDIADKTSDVVVSTTDNYELTNDTVSSVDELKQIVERFEF